MRPRRCAHPPGEGIPGSLPCRPRRPWRPSLLPPPLFPDPPHARPYTPSQCPRVRRPPCDATLAVDAFKIPDEQQTEVPPRRQTRPPHPLRVEPGALLFYPFVKAALFQQSVQLFVKRMRYRPRQVCLCDPNRLLSSLPRFSAHCHARSLLPTVVNHSTIYDENPDLHHGLLALMKLTYRLAEEADLIKINPAR